MVKLKLYTQMRTELGRKVGLTECNAGLTEGTVKVKEMNYGFCFVKNNATNTRMLFSTKK